MFSRVATFCYADQGLDKLRWAGVKTGKKVDLSAKEFRQFAADDHDTTNVGNKDEGHEDWHAFCQATVQGVQGPEWEAMNCEYKDLQQAVKSKKSGEHKKAAVLWALKHAKR